MSGNKRRLQPAIERIQRFLVIEDRGHATPCRVYTGAHNGKGYGRTHIGSRLHGTRRSVLIHRLVYEHHHGQIPEGLQIDHLCRQRPCCEITHLEAVTGAENQRRAALLITHCRQGHEYTPENARYHRTARGYAGRTCRECGRFRAQLKVIQKRFAPRSAT